MAKVWVLLFNVGSDQEGIYSIKVNHEDLIIAFTEEDDATRYALMLEAQDFFTPKPEPIGLRELEEICADSGYQLRVIEKNELMTPPSINVDHTDWQPASTGNEMEQREMEQMRQQLERLLRMGNPPEEDR